MGRSLAQVRACWLAPRATVGEGLHKLDEREQLSKGSLR